MRYVYTVFKNSNRSKSNYIISSMPFIGLIIDGAEDWVKAYNASSKTKINIPEFTADEEYYYEAMRSSIKLWDDSYDTVKASLKYFYDLSDRYFASVCKPIAKRFKLYDIFGADKVDGEFCGNTILCSYYIPNYKFDEYNKENIKNMGEVAGKYVRLFDSMKEYQIDTTMQFTCNDYGGFIKSPVGNAFSDNFVLFSMLCQIQFVLYCVEKFIIDECSTKLRFEYLQYYYCAGILNEINYKTGAHLRMNTSWKCDEFRNAMAHYKVGVALKPEEVKTDDLFYGMVQKYFKCSYYTLKKTMLDILGDLARQIKIYLNINE